MSQFLDHLLQVITYGGIILGIFVVLLINDRGVRKTRANVFLSVLLIAFTFSIFHIWFAGSVIHYLAVQVYYVGDPTFLVIAPLLWFYTEEITGSRVRFSLKSLLHFAPVIFIICCSLTFRFIPEENPFIRFLNEHHRLTIIIFWAIVVIQFSCYQYFIHRKWLVYQQFMRQEVSNTENINIAWVNFFITVFLVITVFFFLGLFVVIHLDQMNWLLKAVGVVFSFSVFALGYKGILQREIFFTHEVINPVETATPPSDDKPVKHDQQLIDRIIIYMEQKKPYLDPELTLSVLAKNLNMSRTQLSQLINEDIGENFYDFVNKYRVEEVKKLMTDPQMKNYNLLGIALEAGFKSKSTFNLIFKRFTGLTPTEYRKNIAS